MYSMQIMMQMEQIYILQLYKTLEDLRILITPESVLPGSTELGAELSSLQY